MRIVGAGIIGTIGLGALYVGTRAWGDPNSEQIVPVGSEQFVAVGAVLVVLAAAIARGGRLAMITGAALGMLIALLGAFAMLASAISIVQFWSPDYEPHGIGPLLVLFLGGVGVVAFLVGAALTFTLARATRALPPR